jgi:hypothetical protein
MTKKHNPLHKKISSKEEFDQVTESIPTDNPLEVLDREVHAPDNYVVTTSEANKPVENNFAFFSRLFAIPLIRDSTAKVQEIANQHMISRFALNQAEATAKLAANIASPYAERYKDHLKKADEFGCKSLDMVESKLPPSVMLSSPQKVYKDVKGRIVTYTSESVEQLVNKYLPKEKNDATMRSENGKKSLANEVKDRLAYRAKSDLSRLAETSQFLQEALHSIQKANTRLQDFVNSLKDGYTTTQHKANQRLHELTVDVIKRIDSAANYAKEKHVMDNLPWLVQPLVHFASNEYEIVRTEMLKSDVAPLQKATNILHVNQTQIFPLFKNTIHGLQEQIREYSLNNKVVREVKSTLGLVSTKA